MLYTVWLALLCIHITEDVRACIQDKYVSERKGDVKSPTTSVLQARADQISFQIREQSAVTVYCVVMVTRAPWSISNGTWKLLYYNVYMV